MFTAPVKEKSPVRNANRVRKHADILLNVLFPPRCAGCRTWSEPLFCEACRYDLEVIAPPFCASCGAPFDALAKVLPDSLCSLCRDNRYHRAPLLSARRAPFEYSGPIREAIHSLKYRGKTALAAPLAELIWSYARSEPAIAQALVSFELIVPIPLHPLRQWRRGYNQSTLLAHELSLLTGIPSAQVLSRTRHTLPQIELNSDERAGNVRGAFSVNEKLWPEQADAQTVLLIDDVMTTGSTLQECARVLKSCGAGEVYALTLARRDL